MTHHKFTPKTPGNPKAFSSPSEFVDGYKAQREMQAKLAEQKIVDDSKQQAITTSLIGKQSGKVRIDRAEVYSRHQIGAKEEDAKRDTQESKVALGGTVAEVKTEQTVVYQKTDGEKKAKTSKAKDLGCFDEDGQNDYLPIRLPFFPETNHTQPKQAKASYSDNKVAISEPQVMEKKSSFKVGRASNEVQEVFAQNGLVRDTDEKFLVQLPSSISLEDRL